MDAFLSDYDNAKSRADDFDRRIYNATDKRSDIYKDIIALSARQTMAATELAISKGSDGQWNISDVRMFMRDVGASRFDDIFLSCSPHLPFAPVGGSTRWRSYTCHFHSFSFSTPRMLDNYCIRYSSHKTLYTTQSSMPQETWVRHVQYLYLTTAHKTSKVKHSLKLMHVSLNINNQSNVSILNMI